jgi:hypothetical protein
VRTVCTARIYIKVSPLANELRNETQRRGVAKTQRRNFLFLAALRLCVSPNKVLFFQSSFFMQEILEEDGQQGDAAEGDE